ncbi:cold-shock protein [Gracilibacillus oryzae]|uniref:Cold-shock protein n=1 Tax=Gracilibacillus oryzae TaxID=1672701 RepID=A0A7C8GQI1_9BACI|nr:cold-shock protein [Gracilibacillus oryzae]KAB8125864.1 cold-shock protein [Gracilibacillus oryzae]
MAYFNNQKEPVKNVETNVWSCVSEDCQGWMRENYSFDKEPTCPICQSEMEREVRVVPEMK